MDTEIFTFRPLEPEKMAFKDSNPTFEIMTKTALSSPLIWIFFAILTDGSPCFFFALVEVNENLTRSMRILILNFFCNGRRKDKNLIQIDSSLNMAKKSLDHRRAFFVIISKLGLLSFNPIISGSNGPNVKISVSIRKRIAWGLQNSPYFWL